MSIKGRCKMSKPGPRHGACFEIFGQNFPRPTFNIKLIRKANCCLLPTNTRRNAHNSCLNVIKICPRHCTSNYIPPVEASLGSNGDRSRLFRCQSGFFAGKICAKFKWFLRSRQKSFVLTFPYRFFSLGREI